MNSPEPQSMPFSPSNVSTLTKDSQISQTSQVSQQKRSASLEDSNLPQKGSFVQQHKRSKSTPETDKKTPAYRHIVLSPGPANVALARGINLETGERNNNNAVIAAAALAAAADIPLPLKHVKRNVEPTVSKSTTVKFAHIVSEQEAEPAKTVQVAQPVAKVEPEQVPLAVPKPVVVPTLPVTLPVMATNLREKEIKITKDEDQLTEAEVDEKTDDERTDDEYSSARGSKTETETASEIFEVKSEVEGPRQEQVVQLQLQLQQEAQEQETHAHQEQAQVQQEQEQEQIQIQREPEAKQVEQEQESQEVQQLVESDDQDYEREEKVDTEIQHEEQKIDFKAPPLSSYQVDPDSGLIGCICGISDDDGFTIQCDVCYRWQHCVCMGFKTSEEVPEDEYTCYYCDRAKWGKFDPLECRRETLDRLDNDSRQPQLLQELNERQQQELAEFQEKQKQNGKRKPLNSDKNDKRRKVESQVEKRKDSSATEVQPKSQTPSDTLPNKDNELLEDGVTAESYQSVYYKLRKNDYKRQSISDFFSRIGTEFFNEYLSLDPSTKASKELRGIKVMSMPEFKAIRLSKLNLPNHLNYISEHKNNLSKKKLFNDTSIQVRQYSDNQKQKFNGISKLSLFITSTNSDSLTIPANTAIIEYLGEIDLFKNYVRDPINQYSSWGTPKPKVLRTSLKVAQDNNLEVVLDSRFVGNESRFIRKACPASTNCRIEPIYIPEDNSFRFLVVTTKPINLKSESADEELRLEWEWDPQHPILKLYENNNSEKFEQLVNADKSALITYIDNILHFAECGCSTANAFSSCAIFKIKKATSYLLRSTRKASSISNSNLAKSKEELILPRKEKEYISWEERLLERDNIIQMNLSVTTEQISEESKEELKNDNEVEVDNEEVKGEIKPNYLFKLPYKQQLLSKNRGRKIVVRPGSSSVEGDVNSGTAHDELPFPIVSDLVVKIEKSIDEKLKPMVKEVEEKITTVLESLPKPSATQEETSKKDEVIAAVEEIQHVLKKETEDQVSSLPPLSTETSSETKKVETSDSTTAQAPPPVVKKLSFADYKKKLK